MAFVLVQHASHGGGAITYGSNVTAGNLLVVGATNTGSSGYTITSITDSVGTKFYVGNLTSNVPHGNTMAIVWGIAGGSGANTVTINWSTGSTGRAICGEFSGCPPNIVQDTSPPGTYADGVTLVNVPVIQTGHSDNLVINLVDLNQTPTVVGPWQQIDNFANNLVGSFQADVPPGTYTPDVTLASGNMTSATIALGAPTSLAIDISTPAFTWQDFPSGASSLVSASFTPPVGALLVVMFAQANSGITPPSLINQPSNSAGSVSWAASALVTQSATTYVGASIWIGKVTSSAAMTVTCTLTSGSQVDWGFGVAVVTGARDPASQNGATAHTTTWGGVPSQTLTPLVGSNSLLLAVVAAQSTTAPTIPSGQSDVWPGIGGVTLYHANVGGGGAGEVWCQYLTDMNLPAGANSQPLNVTAPSAEYAMVAAEILAATGPATNIALPWFKPA